MTFTWTDPIGDSFEFQPHVGAVALHAHDHTGDGWVIVDIPLDRIEEIVAGLRDTARQAARAATT